MASISLPQKLYSKSLDLEAYSRRLKHFNCITREEHTGVLTITHAVRLVLEYEHEKTTLKVMELLSAREFDPLGLVAIGMENTSTQANCAHALNQLESRINKLVLERCLPNTPPPT